MVTPEAGHGEGLTKSRRCPRSSVKLWVCQAYGRRGVGGFPSWGCRWDVSLASPAGFPSPPLPRCSAGGGLGRRGRICLGQSHGNGLAAPPPPPARPRSRAAWAAASRAKPLAPGGRSPSRPARPGVRAAPSSAGAPGLSVPAARR